jgi:hypothetical protein
VRGQAPSLATKGVSLSKSEMASTCRVACMALPARGLAARRAPTARTTAMLPAASSPLRLGRLSASPVALRRAAPGRARTLTVKAAADKMDQGTLVADEEKALSKVPLRRWIGHRDARPQCPRPLPVVALDVSHCGDSAHSPLSG